MIEVYGVRGQIPTRVKQGGQAAIPARVSTADRSHGRKVVTLTTSAERGSNDVVDILRERAFLASADCAARRRVCNRACAGQTGAIVASELSRSGRSAPDLPEALHRLTGWNFLPLAISGMTSKPATRHGGTMATILAGIARAERGRVCKRLPPIALARIANGRRCRWIARDIAGRARRAAP